MNGGVGGVLAQFANNAPLLVAALVFLSGIIALKVVKPPTYQELVTENRNLRGERESLDVKVEGLRDEFYAFKAKHDRERNILGAGVDALYRRYEQMRQAWGNGAPPVTAEIDRRAIRAALDLRETAGTS